MKKLLTYVKSVYQIPQKIKCLSDNRKRKSIPLCNIVMPVFLMLMLQYESFHTIFTSPESMGKRLRNCIKGKIPKVDAVRDMLSIVEPQEIRAIHESVIDRISRNRVFCGGTIGGYVTVAIDGVELFSSTKKVDPEALCRKLKSGETEYFYRSVVCATIGESPHIVLGQEMLKPRDGSDKDEGELTGGKRLIRHLKERHGHFADVIVADALYLNAPYINTVLECGMEAVIRLKDERRLIYQDAEKMFNKGYGKVPSFSKKDKKSKKDIDVEIWDLCQFEIDGVEKKLRVLRFNETYGRENNKESRTMWLVTTLETAPPETLWEMMRKRWDIENNAFHQLKTYYNIDHCYCGSAVEVIFQLILLGFNMRELYLYRRLHNFSDSKITLKSATRKFCDDLLTDNFKSTLYSDTG